MKNEIFLAFLKARYKFFLGEFTELYLENPSSSFFANQFTIDLSKSYETLFKKIKVFCRNRPLFRCVCGAANGGQIEVYY